MKTSKELKERIDILQAELQRVIEYENNQPKINVIATKIADMLHERMCRWNHTSECGYNLSPWPEPGNSTAHLSMEKQRYYDMALNLMDFIYFHINDEDIAPDEDIVMDIVQVFFPVKGQELSFKNYKRLH